jgi:Ca2+/Na+ antiporter
MKKFLKGVVGYFLGTAMFVYTACIFMEPNLLPVFVLMDAICALILFLIFRKRKPKPAKTEGPTQNRTHRSGSFQSEPGTGY